MLLPYVHARLADMNRDELLEFDRLLQCDDWFLMNIIAGTREPPPELQCGVLADMQRFAADALRGGGAN